MLIFLGRHLWVALNIIVYIRTSEAAMYVIAFVYELGSRSSEGNSLDEQPQIVSDTVLPSNYYII